MGKSFEGAEQHARDARLPIGLRQLFADGFARAGWIILVRLKSSLPGLPPSGIRRVPGGDSRLTVQRTKAWDRRLARKGELLQGLNLAIAFSGFGHSSRRLT